MSCGANHNRRVKHANRRSQHKKRVAAHNKKRVAGRVARITVKQVIAKHAKKKRPLPKKKRCFTGNVHKSAHKAKKKAATAPKRSRTAKANRPPSRAAAAKTARKKTVKARKLKKKHRPVHACRLHCQVKTRRSSPKAHRAKAKPPVKAARIYTKVPVFF